MSWKPFLPIVQCSAVEWSGVEWRLVRDKEFGDEVFRVVKAERGQEVRRKAKRQTIMRSCRMDLVGLARLRRAYL